MHFKKFISAMLSGVIAATSLFSTVTAEKQLLGYLGDVNFDSTISVAYIRRFEGHRQGPRM